MDSAPLMILGALLQEHSNLSLKELGLLLSEKIAESESSPSITSVPDPASAYFSPHHFRPNISLLLRLRQSALQLLGTPCPLSRPKLLPPSP